MTEPFLDPPPLSDDFESRTHALAKRMRLRRRVEILGSVVVLLVAVAGVAAAARGGNNQGAQVHIAGVPNTRPGTVPSDRGSLHSGKALTATTTTTRSPARADTETITGTRNHQANGGKRSTAHGQVAAAPSSGDRGTAGASGSGTAATTTTTTTTVPVGGIDPNTWCAPGPAGQITMTASIDAQPVSTGKWHVSGTLTIVNNSGYGYYTTGFVYLSNTTVPGGTGEAWLGWQGTQSVAMGSGFIVGGFALVPAGQTVTLDLEQTEHTDGSANALASGTTPPTVIHQGSNIGTVGHPTDKICDNLPDVTVNFPIGGSTPS